MSIVNGEAEKLNANEQLDAEEFNVQGLLKELEKAEDVVAGVDRRLDDLLSNIDGLLHHLSATSQETSSKPDSS
ncbi:uncharacterized protein EI90DRAFT_3046085 [Cantharellus anzutake]|uniref:uncharacterized protein n=1 Tax=Cantharellus anzutake TaxID=1750568 RepID=UPI00190855C8|nr:uncharacterized protein EI90DRAFT_3095311 [Cantharellus anzutake]XP_038919347.1 uncharacterized protein EI90DRAFT_3046085 [Cantharellus anzutake]KAF8311807.1 hypothetical protein EI90DRAFT_3095311 [Cantharellus anzutake]KAF8336534.1 hypothetical protein EI90DRAFT_3046085 [Cantharellus anzutake]